MKRLRWRKQARYEARREPVVDVQRPRTRPLRWRPRVHVLGMDCPVPRYVRKPRHGKRVYRDAAQEAAG